MAAEAVAFGRETTDRERSASGMATSARELADAFVGADAEMGIDEELIVLRNRTRESREALREARIWNLDIVEDARTMPSSRRARKRGDESFAWARDTDERLVMRDVLYTSARKYFEFGGFEDAAEAVAKEHAATEGLLRDAREKRKAAIDRAADKMKIESESIRRSVEDMKKSKSEKKAFEDEAEAMEDELGF